MFQLFVFLQYFTAFTGRLVGCCVGVGRSIQLDRTWLSLKAWLPSLVFQGGRVGLFKDSLGHLALCASICLALQGRWGDNCCGVKQLFVHKEASSALRRRNNRSFLSDRGDMEACRTFAAYSGWRGAQYQATGGVQAGIGQSKQLSAME